MLHSVIMAEMMQQLGMPHIGYMRQPFGDKKNSSERNMLSPAAVLFYLTSVPPHSTTVKPVRSTYSSSGASTSTGSSRA